MKRYLLLILSTFFLVAANAQFDLDKFEEVFEDEEEVEDSLSTSRSSHSGAYLHTTPQMVPPWFVNPPVAEGNEIYAIGISNPEMDTTQALEMAIYRAQIIANVLRKGTTQLLCDFFQSENDNSSNIVFEHFSRVNSFLPDTADFELIETYRNNFHETMVLIKYRAPTDVKPGDLNRVRLEVYRNEIQASDYGNFESVYELQVKSNNAEEPDPMLYQLTELGPRFDVVSFVDGGKTEVPIYSLRYKGLPTIDSLEYCQFSHGLWNEYFRSLLLFIVAKAREKPENVQYLGETYQRDNIEKNTRGISSNKMRFVLNGITATEKRLKVNMQELPLN